MAQICALPACGRILSRVRYVVLSLMLLAVAGCANHPTAPTSSTTPVPAPPATMPPAATPPPATPSTPAPNPLLSDPRFSLDFYRQLVSDGYEHPPGGQLLHRWQRAPLIYLRTIDSAGGAVSTSLLEQTAAALINTASQWTGGSFGVAGVERGTSTREGQAGWLTVKWSTTGVCGHTEGVGVEGGYIEMNARRPECTCGPLVAKHELGHAMGFYHTNSAADLMAVTFTGCDKSLSDREQFHARVAYGQPIGSYDPK